MALWRTLRDFVWLAVRPIPVADNAVSVLLAVAGGAGFIALARAWLAEWPGYLAPLALALALVTIAGVRLQWRASRYQLHFRGAMSVPLPDDTRQTLLRVEVLNRGTPAEFSVQVLRVFGTDYSQAVGYFALAWQDHPGERKPITAGGFVKLAIAALQHGGGLALRFCKPPSLGGEPYSTHRAEPGAPIDVALQVDGAAPARYCQRVFARCEAVDGQPVVNVLGIGPTAKRLQKAAEDAERQC